MNFRIILTLAVLGFCVLCGVLVVESGLFEDAPASGRACILLQKTAGDLNRANPAADTPVKETPKIEAASFTSFSATGGSPARIVLGAKDPNTEDPQTGFKLQLELDSSGAAISRATFSNGDGKGFDDRHPNNPQPLMILSPVKGGVLSMANREFVLMQQNLQLDLDGLNWKEVEKDSQTARFEALIVAGANETPILKLTKTYTVALGSYMVDVALTVENLADHDQQIRFNLAGPRGIGREGARGDMRKVVGGFMNAEQKPVSSRKGIPSSFLKRKLGLKDATLKYQQAQSREERREAEKHLRVRPGKGGIHFLWAAVTNKYFAAILRPVPDEGKEYCDWVQDKTGWFYNPDQDEDADTGDETVGLNLKIAPVTLAAENSLGSVRTYNFQLYLGPKDKSLFDKNELYKKLGFVHTIDFMGCCCPESIIRPLAFGILWLMKHMYSIIGNYGIVIIVLVCLMRLVQHPITKKSHVSMSKMGTLAPKVEELKKKYANNKAELNKHMMALYREQGASPVMGMLPMMVQMPIWIALWSAVYTSIEMRGAAFLPFWITDLSAPDALFRFSPVTIPLLGKLDSFNLLPILMGVAFYLQQKMMPSQPSTNAQAAQQQKMMKIMMPVLFPLMLYKGPSGVNLYIMSSVFAGAIEQYFIRKHTREKEQAQSKGLVAATSKTGGKVKKKKPKPFYRTH
jgi:YidC/Oxa1 family membrane protein insertase